MYVLIVLKQSPWILHFSRPYPSFKLLFSTVHLPYIAFFYFSNWISCVENINIVCPVHVRELITLPLSQLQHLYGPARFQMLLFFSHLWYPGSSPLLHTEPFWLPETTWPVHWSIACGLGELQKSLPPHLLHAVTVPLFSTVLQPLSEPCQFISDTDFDVGHPGSSAAIEWAATDAAALTFFGAACVSGWMEVGKENLGSNGT